MKKKTIFFLILLCSTLFIPFIKVNADYTQEVSTTYQINESSDDAIYYPENNYFDSDDPQLLIVSNILDTKVGLVFDNVTILDNATVTEAYLSFYNEDLYEDENNYWITIYGIDEDDTQTFVNVTDFESRSYTTTFKNWNTKDLEGNSGWVNSTNIANILNEVKSRSGWNNTNIGFFIISVASWDAYRMAYSYDGNSTLTPKLYVKYQYIVDEEHKTGTSETFLEFGCNNLFSIYLYETFGGLSSFDNAVLYDAITNMGGGGVIGTVTYSGDETITYSKGRYWITGWDADGNIWLWNSSNKVDWYGTELDSHVDKRLLLGVSALQFGHWDLYSVMDSNGDIHIAWTSETNAGAQSKTYYIKVITFADGSITDLGTDELSSQTDARLKDLIVDGQDYPISLLGDSSGYLRLIGSSTKDGTWTDDYNKQIEDGTEYGGQLLPLNNDSGKDFIVAWIKDSNGSPRCKYFDESTETLGATIGIDGNWRTLRFGGDYQYSNDRNTIKGLTIHDSNREDDETFFSTYGWDVSEGKAQTRIYRTKDGGTTWTYKILFEEPDHASTDFQGHIIRYNDDGDLIAIYRHNDDNDGNHTFFWNFLEYDNIDEYFTGVWDIEDEEMFSFSGLDVDQYGEASCSFSIIRGGNDEYLIDYGMVIGTDHEDVSILDLTITEFSGGSFYRVYNSTGHLIGTYTTLELARRYIDELCKARWDATLGNTTVWVMGLIGIIMMALSFVMFYLSFASGDYLGAFRIMLLLFFIGMAMFIGWLWG